MNEWATAERRKALGEELARSVAVRARGFGKIVEVQNDGPYGAYVVTEQMETGPDGVIFGVGCGVTSEVTAGRDRYH